MLRHYQRRHGRWVLLFGLWIISAAALAVWMMIFMRTFSLQSERLLGATAAFNGSIGIFTYFVGRHDDDTESLSVLVRDLSIMVLFGLGGWFATGLI